MSDWRLVKVGETAPKYGGHGSWVETNHPAVVACMGSGPACAENGCQLRSAHRRSGELLRRVETLERALGGLLKELEFVEQQALGELAILAADVARAALKGGSHG